MAFAHWNNKYLCSVITSLVYFSHAFHMRIYGFFLRSIQIYLRHLLRAETGKKNRQRNQIEFSPTNIIDVYCWLLQIFVWFDFVHLNRWLLFPPETFFLSFSLRFYLLPMCYTSSICFSSYTFRHHFINIFVWVEVEKRARASKKINLCGLSDTVDGLLESPT